MRRLGQQFRMPDLELEIGFRESGRRLVAGVDEAGRGPLAGPVTAAAVILPTDLRGDEDWLAGIDDSKRLTAARREAAAAAIRHYALDWSVAQVASTEIDQIGIGNAVVQAMMAAVSNLRHAPDALLLDWVHITECYLPYQRIVKGDAKSLSIAAASILAKVHRDREMQMAALVYPGLRVCPAQRLRHPPPHAEFGGKGPLPNPPAIFQPAARRAKPIRGTPPLTRPRRPVNPPVSLSPQDIGRIGERLARSHLEAQGYRIVQANYRCRWVRSISSRGDGLTWVFVEVRTRRSGRFGEPEESVTASKAQRLTLTAQDFLSQQPTDEAALDWRIDLVAIRLAAGVA